MTTQKRPLLTEIIEGEPIQVEGRELVPLVRVTSLVKRRASLSGDRVHGRAYGFVRMRPVALLEKKGDEEQRHRIQNGTVRVLSWLALVALAVPWLAALLTYLWRRREERCSQHRSA
jgi:hypothetical protein